MAKTAIKGDRYSQRQTVECAMSNGATTATSEAATNSYKASDKVGWIIQRVEYSAAYSIYQTFDADGDKGRWGLATRAQQPSGGWTLLSDGIVDYNHIQLKILGAIAADTMWYSTEPIIKDFSGLIGGGKLVHPATLHLWTYSDVAGIGFTLHCAIDYQEIVIDAGTWEELFQAIYIRTI